jgi:putative transposase
VPNAIQCDNGTPFVAVRSRGGISRLSAWWMSLGIRILRSRPGCPQDNGAHERMHADVRGDIQSNPAASVDAEQRRLTRWRQELNHVRPHEALNGKVPADIYKVTERRRPTPSDYVYSARFCVRCAYSNGQVRFRNDDLFVGEVFGGYEVGIEVVAPMRIRVWFRDVDLGEIETVPEVDVACFDRSSLTRNKRAS